MIFEFDFGRKNELFLIRRSRFTTCVSIHRPIHKIVNTRKGRTHSPTYSTQDINRRKGRTPHYGLSTPASNESLVECAGSDGGNSGNGDGALA